MSKFIHDILVRQVNAIFIVLNVLTHLSLVTQIQFSELSQHWFR